MTKRRDCKMCNLGLGRMEGLSQREVATQLGIGKSSVGRHRAHYKGPEEPSAVGDAPEGFVIERMSLRDPETGSWIKYKPDAEAALQQAYEKVDPAAILNRLDRFEAEPQGGESVFVVSLNDTQLGKAEGGGTAATLERVKRCVYKAQARIAELRAIGRDLGTLIIIGGGDIIEGCTIYPNQDVNNDLTQSEQIDVAISMILWVIDNLAPLFEDVYILATKGNHGENRRNGSKTAARDNNDTMVFRQAQKATERDPNLQHVKYIICEPEKEAVYMEVPGTPWTLGTTHGDIFGKFVPGQTKMLKAWNWYKNMAVSKERHRPDVLVTHHFHHEEKADWGSCLWVQTRALDGGSAYFEQYSGQYSEDGMLTFVMTPDTRYQDEAILLGGR